MSVESPKRSWRTSQARSTRAPISLWSVSAPNSSASSKPISGGTPGTYERGRTPRSIPREVLDDLRVALGPRTEGDQLEALVAGLERPGHRGPHPDRVERPDLLHLVIEFHVARAGDHHVDLFRLLVAVREGVALARLHPLQRDPDLLGVQVAMGEAGLLDLAEALPRSHVLDLPEVLDRVVHGGRAYTLAACKERALLRSRSRLPGPRRPMTSLPGLASTLGRFAHRLDLARFCEAAEPLLLELPHLARLQLEATRCLAQGGRLVAVDAEAQLDHLALVLGKVLNGAPQRAIAEADGDLLGRPAALIRDELAHR